MDNDILTLQRMAAEREARLAQNEDFLVWRALSKAIDALSRDGGAPTANIPPPRAKSARISQADGAVMLIEQKGFPLRTQDILEALPEIGVSVTGTNPTINLSSSLSRDPRLLSVNWAGGKAWWIEGKDLPREPDIFG